MKLNGLHWTGIVLSILWVIIAGVYTHNEDVRRANDFGQYSYRVCSESKALNQDTDLSSCEVEKAEGIATFMKGSDGNVAFAALAPIPFAWLGVFILFKFCQIQIAGLRVVVPWSTLSRSKKVFTMFCGLAIITSILFACIDVMNLYVDTKVPVGLPTTAMILKTDIDRVRAEGTWTRTGASEDSSLAYPLQTSVIDCNRTEGRCIESRAIVAGNILTTEGVVYDIESWTENAIVFRNDSYCTEEVFTLDLNSNVVNGAGKRVRTDQPVCKMNPSDEEKWGYRLADGFPVYWELRKKSRPAALRVIQAFFGN